MLRYHKSKKASDDCDSVRDQMDHVYDRILDKLKDIVFIVLYALGGELDPVNNVPQHLQRLAVNILQLPMGVFIPYEHDEIDELAEVYQ